MAGVNIHKQSEWRHSGIALLALLFLLPVFIVTPAGAQNASPTFADVIAKADAARVQNDLPQAIELYNQAVQLKPDWPDGWWYLGSMQYATNAYPAAIDALTHYLQLVPKAAPAFALRGLSEFETGEYSGSLQDIQQALALGAANQSRNAEILRYHEGLAQTRTGRFQDALQTYKVFAQKGVNNPELLVAIGLAGLQMPLLPKDFPPDQQDLVTATGDAAYRFMAGGEKDADPAFQQLFQRYPTTANVHYLYGYLLFPTDPDKALVEFKHELEITPSNAAANEMLAWSYLTEADAANALPYAQKAAAQNPTLPGVQLVFGRSLSETGNLNDGIEHLEKALQGEPNNLEIHIALATAYSKSGRKEDARRERLWCLQAADNGAKQVAQP
jgi:tetratricopeptide (TPR) repeat protein